MDDGPGLALVKGERGLAAAAAVEGAAVNGHLVLLAGGVVDDGGAGSSADEVERALAGEVGAAGVEGRRHVVVDVAAVVRVVAGAEGRGLNQLHVRRGDGGHAEDGGRDGACKVHLGCVFGGFFFGGCESVGVEP